MSRFQLGESDLAGLQDLELLDLSNNFLASVPSSALRRLTQLKTLVLHSNLIQVSFKHSLCSVRIHKARTIS